MKHVMIIFSIFAFTACKCSKATSVENHSAVTETSAASASSDPVEIQETVNPQDVKKELPDTIRLVVSFISIGEGTDGKGPAMLDAVIQRFFEETGKKINFDRVAWGREGEQDYCFSLSEIDPIQQSKFIENLRVTFKDHPLVQIAENKKNRFKR